MLARLAIAPETIDRFVCHPGGPKIILALEQVLKLDPGTLDHEREVLATHGNMSAPTVLFVLERVLRAGLPERSLLVAMGPGFTASCLALERRS
jgi:alkylresorcinol/alkylpyrone synthase